MWKRIVENKFFTVLAIAIVLIAGVYWYGRRQGKKALQRYSQKLPNSGSGIPQTSPGVSWDATPMAEKGHRAMDGPLSRGSVLDDWYVGLLSLTDDQLTAVYNRFNELYFEKGHGTMYDWIMDESFMEQPMNRTNLNKVLERMRRLNLLGAAPDDKKSWWQVW